MADGFRGMMALYYNSRSAAPLVWCVAPLRPDQVPDVSAERCVREIVFVGDVMRRSDARVRASDRSNDDRMPTGWFVASGVVSFEADIAIITAIVR